MTKKVVIPLQRYKIVPEHLPMNFLCCPTLPKLGTKASNIVDMDVQSNQQNTQLRIDAYTERERLEEEGIGDQLSELQQFSWKIFDRTKLKSLPWGPLKNQKLIYRIEILLRYSYWISYAFFFVKF